jgi:hypothetical protein
LAEDDFVGSTSVDLGAIEFGQPQWGAVETGGRLRFSVGIRHCGIRGGDPSYYHSPMLTPERLARRVGGERALQAGSLRSQPGAPLAPRPLSGRATADDRLSTATARPSTVRSRLPRARAPPSAGSRAAELAEANEEEAAANEEEAAANEEEAAANEEEAAANEEEAAANEEEAAANEEEAANGDRDDSRDHEQPAGAGASSPIGVLATRLAGIAAPGPVPAAPASAPASLPQASYALASESASEGSVGDRLGASHSGRRSRSPLLPGAPPMPPSTARGRVSLWNLLGGGDDVTVAEFAGGVADDFAEFAGALAAPLHGEGDDACEAQERSQGAAQCGREVEDEDDSQ